jgi:hypothetical protein
VDDMREELVIRRWLRRARIARWHRRRILPAVDPSETPVLAPFWLPIDRKPRPS